MHHSIYAIFSTQTALENGGKTIELLRGAGTWFSTWFYVMHCLLHLKMEMELSLCQTAFCDLDLTEHARFDVLDIKSDIFWKAMFVLLQSVYPALLALRCCDKNKPAMEQIYLLANHITLSIKNSINSLNESSFFGRVVDDGGLIVASSFVSSKRAAHGFRICQHKHQLLGT